MKWIINREKVDAGFDEAHFHLSLASLIAKIWDSPCLGFEEFASRFCEQMKLSNFRLVILRLFILFDFIAKFFFRSVFVKV